MRFHFEEFEFDFILFFTEFIRFIKLILSSTIFLIIVILFSPTLLVSFGFMKKLSKPLIDFEERILEYFLKKMYKLYFDI